MDRVERIGTARVIFFAAEGHLLDKSSDINDFISGAKSADADFLAIPRSRLGANVLRLETRVAGEAFQKLVNYQLRCAILGDLRSEAEASKALRDFLYETNKGRMLWFLEDEVALRQRLGAES